MSLKDLWIIIGDKCPEPSPNIKDVIKRLHYDREKVVTPSLLYDFSRMFHYGYYMGRKSAFISLRTTEKLKHNVTKGTVNVISIQCGHTGGMFYITAALKISRLFWISPECLPNNKSLYILTIWERFGNVTRWCYWNVL